MNTQLNISEKHLRPACYISYLLYTPFYPDLSKTNSSSKCLDFPSCLSGAQRSGCFLLPARSGSVSLLGCQLPREGVSGIVAFLTSWWKASAPSENCLSFGNARKRAKQLQSLLFGVNPLIFITSFPAVSSQYSTLVSVLL